MLLDELRETKKKMVSLSKIEQAAHDAEKRKKNDSDYASIVSDLYSSISQVSKAKTEMGYSISDETIQLLEEGIEKVEGVIESGVVEDSALGSSRQIIRKITPCLNREWKNYHQKKVSLSMRKLNTLGKLADDTAWVEKTKKNINNAEEWESLSTLEDGTNSRLDLFIESLEAVNQLEKKLDLSPEIQEFLDSVTYGRAKASDISPNVIEWIKNEKLEDKFVISFKY